MDFLLEGVLSITPQQLVMYVVGVKGVRAIPADADGLRRDHGKPAVFRRH